MTGAGLQKYFHDVPELLAHPFFDKTGLRDDLSIGDVFPAIRKNEVHFYHGGARLCVYKGGHMLSNNRYLDLPDKGKSRDVRIPEDRFTRPAYKAIKQKCMAWRPAGRELVVVSGLFPEFSIARSNPSAGRALLLDIECRFPGSPEAAGAEPETDQDMIDCLFLTPEGALVCAALDGFFRALAGKLGNAASQ
ncbi:MAG: hypothetical protein K2Z80_25705 [Xanthobacteraceae bacterium]|nr:hypothetical protein [Xanthobacteraceae bacterium]